MTARADTLSDSKLPRAAVRWRWGCGWRGAPTVGAMVAENLRLVLIERVLERPVAAAALAVWGFANRTGIVTLAAGDQVVVQRYRRREDASYRLRVMRALWKPAAEAGIAGHRPWTSGERPSLGQPGRDERRDGGDAVRDAVTTSLEQTGLVEKVIRRYRSVSNLSRLRTCSGSPPVERRAVASGGRDR